MENIIVFYHNYSLFVDDTIFMSGLELLVSDEMFLHFEGSWCCLKLYCKLSMAPTLSLSVFLTHTNTFKSPPPAFCIAETASTYHGGRERLPWQSSSSAPWWKKTGPTLVNSSRYLSCARSHTHTNKQRPTHTTRLSMTPPFNPVPG